MARRAALWSGLVALAVALAPPLDAAAARNLTAHMAQHLLLMSVAAPLLVLGWPRPGPRLRGSWHAWVAAGVVAHAVALVLWHVPGAYDAALSHDPLHGLEHVSYLGTSLLFWWVVLRAAPPASWGWSFVAVFVMALPDLLLGVAITLADHVWYPAYAGTGALHDQQTAGVLMWAGGGALVTIAALAVFARWLVDMERHAPGVAA